MVKKWENLLNWNVEEQKIDSDAIAKADYIINLAGAGVMEKRWSEKYKKEIEDSRDQLAKLIIASSEA